VKLVRIVHPDGLEADVPEVSVPQHRASGWELANPPTPRERVRQILVGGGLAEDEADRVAAAAYPDDDKKSKGAPAQSGASSSEDQSPRRRRETAKDGE